MYKKQVKIQSRPLMQPIKGKTQWTSPGRGAVLVQTQVVVELGSGQRSQQVKAQRLFTASYL